MQGVQKVELSGVTGKTYSECIRLNRPCIISGLHDVLPELRLWNIQTAKDRIVDKDLKVYVMPKGGSLSSQGFFTKMRASEYLSQLESGFSDPSKIFYLAMQRLDEDLPELKPYVLLDKLLPQNLIAASSFWLGQSKTNVYRHMDPYDNFFMQLMGQKTFYLYPPTDSKYLYPFSAFGNAPEASPVNPLNVDLEAFPLARHASPIEITLKAGDALFLPIYWWHAVQGGAETTMSVNIWCKGRTFSSLGGAMQLMPRAIKQGIGSAIKKFQKQN
jgi:hypothetical protein